MPFCVNCGTSLGDDVRFCGNCGTPVGGAVTAPTPLVEPLDYTIQGDNLQVARVRLKPGQEVYAEAGKMVYKTANVDWDTRMSGATLGEKLLGALRRTITGESLFLTYFRANGAGEVGFAGSYPGRIQAFDLAAGQSIMAQRDAFLFAQPTVQFNIAWVKKLGAGFFGGEGFILEKLTGKTRRSSTPVGISSNSRSPPARRCTSMPAISWHSMRASVTTFSLSAASRPPCSAAKACSSPPSPDPAASSYKV